MLIILRYRVWPRRVAAVFALVVVLVMPYVLVNSPTVSLFGNAVTFNIVNLGYALVASVAVLSLVLLVGYNGQLSLAPGFFLGLGAYLSIALADRLGVPFVAAGLLSAVGCGIVGALVGLPALRIRGTYLALVTITLAAVFPALVRLPAVKGVTGGSDGLVLEGTQQAPSWLPIAEAPTFLGQIPVIGPLYIGTRPLSTSQAASVWTYFAILVAMILIFWLVAGVLKGRVGRAIIAVRDNEISAAANGVNVARAKVMVFGLSAAVAGLAGCLYAALYRIVAPDNFGLTLAIYLLFGMILGGHRSMAGAVVGGFAVSYLPAMTTQMRHFSGVPDRYLTGPTASLTLGLLLVLFPMLMPAGVAEQVKKVFRRREPRATASAEQRRRAVDGPNDVSEEGYRSPVRAVDRESAAVD